MKKLRLILVTLALTLGLSQCAAPLILAGGAGALGYYFGAERRDADTITEDEKAQARMIELMRQAGLDVNNIEVMTYNHKMLLVGAVPTEADLQLLNRLARQVPYVRKVYNRVRVGAPRTPDRAREDGWIAAKVKAEMVKTKGLTSAAIRYTVYDGTVYLMGLVSKQEAQKAIAAASRVKGVRKVVDAMDRL
ncbi:Osmotically-inducible protein OsmY, contains BON domain [Sulfurivirga caldicuralii]|uniref:Osmotically-inducible protein OsmY, contains BON domain n=1 Tax=Sulfurivirga caldicuralii TaxID=364032 RepID=A0A1N6DV21_9GAMM|nr:BON domain-containing protein [Sulfurivirga caldicuralii]SIN74563.1 Osmotically-inducible protein OsmY, contains BON domain [Sulfurivirga caldicuralii]